MRNTNKTLHREQWWPGLGDSNSFESVKAVPGGELEIKSYTLDPTKRGARGNSIPGKGNSRNFEVGRSLAYSRS